MRVEEHLWMKNLFPQHAMALAVLAVSVFASAQSTELPDSWSVLTKITHKRTYCIETRDRRCRLGKITEITPDHLTANLYTSTLGASARVTFPRADVLRVTAGLATYYSGRSSWSDVIVLRVAGRARLKIVTRVGKTYNVKPPYSVSDEGMTLHASGKLMAIPKGEIARIYYVVARPLTDFGEYAIGELGPMIVFDPDWYVYSLHLERYVSVLLYDASGLEDDSPAECLRPGH